MPTLSDLYDGTSRAGGWTPGQKSNKRDSYLTKRGYCSLGWSTARRPLPQQWKWKTSATLEIGMRTCVPNRASMVGATGLSGAEATTEQSPTSVPRIGDRRTGDPNRRPVAGAGAEEAKKGD